MRFTGRDRGRGVLPSLARRASLLEISTLVFSKDALDNVTIPSNVVCATGDTRP